MNSATIIIIILLVMIVMLGFVIIYLVDKMLSLRKRVSDLEMVTSILKSVIETIKDEEVTKSAKQYYDENNLHFRKD